MEGHDNKLGGNKLWRRLLFSHERHFVYLFVAVFFLLSSFMFNTFYVVLTGAAVGQVITIVVSLLRFMGFVLLIDVYFVKNKGVTYTFDFNRLLKTFLLSLILWVLIIGAYSLFSIIIGSLSGLITAWMMEKRTLALGLIIFYFLLAFVIGAIILSFVMLYYVMMSLDKKLGVLFPVLKLVTKGIFKKFLSFLMINLIMIAFLFIGAYAQVFVGTVISQLFPYAFLQKFLQVAFSSIVNAWMLIILFQGAKELVLKNYSDALMTVTSKNKLPLVLIAPLVLIIVVSILYPPQSNNPHKKYIAEVESYLATGDLLVEVGLEQEAIVQYNKAVSRVLTLKAYYSTIIGLTDKDDQMVRDGNDAFTRAHDIDPTNPYRWLFLGNIDLHKENGPSALNAYEKAVMVPDFHPDVMVNGYKIARALDDSEQSKRRLEWMITNEVFNENFNKYTTTKTKKLKKLLLEVEDLQELVEPKLAIKAYNKMAQGNYSEAKKALLSLLESYPKSPEINYYLSLLNNEARNEQSNYGATINYAKKFAKEYEGTEDEEVAKQVFLAETYVATDDTASAEAVYRDLYEADKTSVYLGNKYIYVLIMNGKYEEAMATIESFSDTAYDLSMTYHKAMCLLNLGDYEASLYIMTTLEKFDVTDQEENYDLYLYAYSLAYANAATDDTVMAYVSSLGNSIIKPYVQAMKEWSLKNTDSATIYMDEVLALNGKLGYAWYAQGVNYYEFAVRNETGDFNKVIETYHKALSYIPDHVEIYFSLGHAYDKAGDYEDAIAAFYKVVDMLPYEDHRVDPYGISVHAYGKIEELKSLIPKEVD